MEDLFGDIRIIPYKDDRKRALEKIQEKFDSTVRLHNISSTSKETAVTPDTKKGDRLDLDLLVEFRQYTCTLDFPPYPSDKPMELNWTHSGAVAYPEFFFSKISAALQYAGKKEWCRIVYKPVMKIRGRGDNQVIPVDLTPAIPVTFRFWSTNEEWHIIPHNDYTWKLTNAKFQRRMLRELNQSFKHLKDTIRLIKYCSKRKKLELRSFLVVSFVVAFAKNNPYQWTCWTVSERVGNTILALFQSLWQCSSIPDLQTQRNINNFETTERNQILAAFQLLRDLVSSTMCSQPTQLAFELRNYLGI